MKEIYEAVIKAFFAEFTWRRLFAGFVLLAVILLVYERYTCSFRLSRLQKATELLLRLQEVQSSKTNSTPDMQRAWTALASQAAKAIEAEPPSFEFIPAKLTFSTDSLRKFLAGGCLYFVFALFQLPKVQQKAGRDALGTTVMLAVAAGGVATQVPTVWWPWFHVLIYPLLFIAVVGVILLPVALVLPAFARARNKAQAINCISNLKQVGLAARLWAVEHNDQLPPDFPSMRKELGSEKISCCPTDHVTHYEILSPGASPTDPFVVYARCSVHNNVVLGDGSAHPLGSRQLVPKGGKWTVESLS